MPKQKTAVTQPEPVEMTPEQIAAAERDRAALVSQKLKEAASSPHRSEQQPAVAVVEPEVAPQGPSSSEIQALIDQANAEHHAAMAAMSEVYDRRMADLLKQRRVAEDAQAKKVNVALAPALGEVLATVRAGNAIAIDTARASSTEVRDTQIDKERARVQPRLDAARKAAGEIQAFAKIYNETINEVLSMSLTALRTGLPMQGLAAERSVTLTAGVLRSAGLARELIDGSLRNISTLTRDIEALLSNTEKWGGSLNSVGVRSQESVIELNQMVYDLGNPEEVVGTLNALVSGIGGQLEGIAKLREQYRGSPETRPDVELTLPTPHQMDQWSEVADGKPRNASGKLLEPKQVQYDGMHNTDLWKR